MVWHACSIPLFRDDRTRIASLLISCSSIYYQLASKVCGSDTSGSRPKVPFAVTRHIYYQLANIFKPLLIRFKWIG